MRLISQDWMDAEAFAELNLHAIVLPQIAPPHTALLDLTPLPRSALQQPDFEALYKKRFTHFNPIQTQAFHTLYHTDENVLLGAPTGAPTSMGADMLSERTTTLHMFMFTAQPRAASRGLIMHWW